MEQLTCDLQGVAVYLDDILVRGENAVDYLENLQQLLQRLEGHGLRCRLEKCITFKTPLAKKATGNNLMNSNSLEKL